VNPNYLNTILFVLKIAGVIITGRATIVGLFKHEIFETVEITSPIIGAPSKTEKRITKHGRRAFGWAVVGVLISLAAQATDQTLSIRRAEASSRQTRLQMEMLSNAVKRAETQLTVANESLDRLEKIVGRFERLSVTLKCWFRVSTLPTNVITRAEQAATSLWRDPHPTADMYPGVWYNVTWTQTEFGLIEVRDLRRSRSETNFTWVAETLTYDGRLFTNWFDTPALKQEVASFFKKPSLVLQLYASNSIPNAPDFESKQFTVSEANLRFSTNDAFVIWKLDFPPQYWDMKNRMTSATNLFGAHAAVLFRRLPKAFDWRGIRPSRMIVDFDKASLVITNFEFQSSLQGDWGKGIVTNSNSKHIVLDF
jgi:hypothetical protein